MNFSITKAGRPVAAVAVSAALALAVAGCGGSSGSSAAGTSAATGGASAGASGITLVQPGTLTACTHLPYKPFEYNDNGKVVGFDVSLVKLLADKLGAKVNVINVEWSPIISGAAFAAKKCDVGMGAATITPERQKAVLFSKPYMNADQALLVKASTPYKDLAALKGKKLGVQTATTGQIYASKHEKQFGYTSIVYPDSLSLFNAVKSGAVDAAIQDNAPEFYYAKTNPGMKVTAVFPTGEKYGFMVKKNDPNATKLVDQLNAVIAKAKQDGTYNKIFKQWFGALPKSATK